MRELRELIQKTAQTVKEEGIQGLPARVVGHLERERRKKRYRKQQEKSYRDLLFISGCNEQLPHPHRYRVLHQMEQLQCGGYTCDTVYFEDLTLSLVRCYSAFVIFRCPYTETLNLFVKEAKELHKPVWYDVDDLVIDTKYTDQIPWLSGMEPKDREAYDDNVRRMGRMLTLCDGAITTTKVLSEVLQSYVPEVLINRNVASDEMLSLSLQAFEKHKKAEQSSEKIILGYFSGSPTHLDDLKLMVPVLQKLMEEYQNLELLIVGLIDLPDELSAYKSRIQRKEFVDYRELPGILAEVDINLAPLTDTVFNAAKSENKWVEAALVHVPTVASRVGAFEEMIRDHEDGILCSTKEEWYDALSRLISNPCERTKIADRAFERCKTECVTIYHSRNLCDWIEKHMTKRCAFVLPALSISGGIRVAIRHSEMLYEKGCQVSFYLLEGKEEWVTDGKYRFPAFLADQTKMKGKLDFAVATMWNTVHFVEELQMARRKFYLVQNYEPDFYAPGSVYRIAAASTYAQRFPVEYLTVSKWCQKWLKDRYGVQAEYLPNGIFCENYTPYRRTMTGKVRILVEGDCNAPHKNVDESFSVIQQLDPERYEIWYLSYQGTPKSWYRVDRFFHQVPYEKTPGIYESCDILLKTSILESFSYPPLEMMASGGFVVAVPNEGNKEYLEDGKNCLLYTQGSISEAVEAIQRICRDAELQERLYRGGIETAESRDWEKVCSEVTRVYLR